MLCWISYPFCSSQNFDKKCGLFKQRNVASRCSAQGPSFKAAKITQHFEPAHIFHHPPKACGSSTVSGLPPLTTPIGGSKTDSGPQSGRFHRESPPSTLVQPLSKNFDHELKPGSIKAASAVDITSECDFKKKKHFQNSWFSWFNLLVSICFQFHQAFQEFDPPWLWSIWKDDHPKSSHCPLQLIFTPLKHVKIQDSQSEWI